MTQLTYAEYDALPGHRASEVKHMDNGPRDYRHHMANRGEVDTDAMAFGRAAHVATLEPDLLPLQFAVWKGGRRAGSEWTDFLAANIGMEPLREADYLRALQVRNAVHSHPEAAKVLRARGECEKTVTWTDPDTGLPCKARIDRLTLAGREIIDDLKTTSRLGDLRRFRNSAAELLYHMQLAMYQEGVRISLGIECGARIIAAETSGAFEVAVLKVSGDELWAGSDLFHELLGRIAECEATGEWPFRYPEQVDLDLPPWALGDGIPTDFIDAPASTAPVEGFV